MSTKDVKSSKPETKVAAVLSPSVQKSSTPPLSRSGKPKKRVVIEDWHSVGGDSPSDDEDLPPSPRNVVGPSGSDCRKQTLAASSQDPLLAVLGGDPTEADAFLLREILALRSGGGRHEGSLAESKHLYTVTGSPVTVFASSGTEVPISVANVAGGTTVSTRLTNTIRLHKLRLKFVFARNLQAIAASQNVIMPVVHCLIFRDKTPATPGTAPTVHGTDANPPASSSLIFSRLGAAQDPSSDRTLVVNPITEDLYHIYEYRQFHFNNEQNFVGSLVASQVTPTQYVHHSTEILLNSVEQVYASSAATPITNPIYVVLWSDFVNNTDNGFQHSYRVVSDLEFHDVQDD